MQESLGSLVSQGLFFVAVVVPVSRDLCASGLAAVPCVPMPLRDLKGGCGIANPISPSALFFLPKAPEPWLWPCFRSGFSPRFPHGSPEGPELGYLTAPTRESTAPLPPSTWSWVAFPQSLCWCESSFGGLGSGGKTKSLSLPQLSRKLEEAFKWETHGCL